jgi:hypothetical protein
MCALVSCPVALDFEPASFRDRQSRVFLRDGVVYRALSPAALQEFEFISDCRFFSTAMAERQVIPTLAVGLDEPGEGLEHSWAGALRHERVPFVSYPYEWCFGMLHESARLHLDLLEAAVVEGAILKDATPFNVQFHGSQPVFIDVGSFVRHQPNEAWVGYRQFCQMQLYPLMLQAYRGVDFQPWLRGRIDGIPPVQFSRLLSSRDWLRRGVLTHVVLHAALESKAGGGNRSVKRDLHQSGFHKDLILANVRKLKRIVDRLNWSEPSSHWSEYDASSDPVRHDGAAKEEFLQGVLKTRQWGQVWDFGCNLGRYSRIAAEHADFVVAMDQDHWTIEKLFRSLQKEHNRKILPLVMNFADASPGLGWNGRERRRLEHRGAPDLVLCLALLHHLVIRENLRIPDVLDWLARLGGRVVIEFVDRSDPQVVSLLRNRSDACEDYSRESFEQSLKERFEIVSRRDLPSGTRTLFEAAPR